MEYVIVAVKLNFKRHQNNLQKGKNDTELF